MLPGALTSVPHFVAQNGPPQAGGRDAAPAIWLAALVLPIVIASTVLLVRGLRRRRRATGDGRCGKCGYLVKGLTTFVCPECGSDLREVGIVGGARVRAAPPGAAVAFLTIVGWKLALAAAAVTFGAIGGIEYYADHYHATHWEHTETIVAVPRSGAFAAVEVKLSERFTASGRPPYRGTPRAQDRQVTVDLRVGSKRAQFVRDALAGTNRYLDPAGVERTNRAPVAEALRVWAGNQGVDVTAPAVAAELDLIADAINQADRAGAFWDVMANHAGQRFVVKSAATGTDPGLADWYYVLSVGGAIVLGVGLLALIWVRNRGRLAAALAEASAWRPAAVDPGESAPRGGGAGTSSPVVRTLSVMFSDVKDYTARAARESRLGILDLVRRHRELVQPIARRRGGRIVKSMGDGLLIVFESATDAVLAGIEIQAAAAAHARGAFADRDKVELRIAVSTGEVAEDDGDVFGESVNLASRAQQHAAAGEVLFTEATWATVNRREVRGAEAGTFELKGIDGPVRLFRAAPAGRTAGAVGPDDGR